MSVPLSRSQFCQSDHLFSEHKIQIPAQCSMVQWPINQHLETFVWNNVSVLPLLLDQNHNTGLLESQERLN